MGRDAFETSARARALFEEADDTLGLALSKLCFEGPEEDLRRTEIQQPAILTTSLALLCALEDEIGPLVSERARFVGGHSLGEYSALVAAGALRFKDAVRTVRLRGRLMQEAVAEGRGAMAAVLGIPAAVVEDACLRAEKETGLVATPANFNSPQQTVIAGDAAAVEIACNRARELGAKRTLPLPVSAPFHCRLMEPAARALEPALSELEFSPPSPPVMTNVEAKANVDAERIPELLRRQVTAPVRFTDMITEMKALGVDGFLEVGPGRVLSGLIARIDRRARRANFSSTEDLVAVREFIGKSEDSD